MNLDGESQLQNSHATETIGIGITTRNRADVLALCLHNFDTFLPKNHKFKFIVVDDNSDNYEENKLICEKYNYIEYVYNTDRLGVAKSKNTCLKFLSDCDYLFLFDDDCFPQKDGWDELYINAHKKTGVNHLMHLFNIDNVMKTSETEHLESYNNCTGVLLFITKEVLVKVGGMDKRFKIYGYEHAQYSRRIEKSGLNHGHGSYLTPKKTREYIFSLDLEKVVTDENRHKTITGFKSTIEVHLVEQHIKENEQILNDLSQIFQEI